MPKPPPPRIVYDVQWPWMSILPPSPELEAQFQSSQLIAQEDAAHGYSLRKRQVNLLQPGAPNTGLGLVAAYELFLQGYTVELPVPNRRLAEQGRTSLRSWLRAVVANLWISAKRRRTPLGITGPSDVADPRVCEPMSNGSECEDLLRPTFTSAVEQVESEDRLLLKMLLVDEVPQQALAKSLGIHSGNVTRRRQRAAATMWQFVRSAGIRSRCAQRFEECLHEVLAGEDRRLSQALGAALTQAIESGDSPTSKGALG